MMTEMVCHLLGGTAIAVDVVSLWLVGHKTSVLCRRIGMSGMSTVNALFAVQGLIMGNWTLLIVSAYSTAWQIRAAVNWREK